MNQSISGLRRQGNQAKPFRIFLLTLLLSQASCSHVAPLRDPASDIKAEAAFHSCSSLNGDGQKSLQTFLKATAAVARALKPIANLAHVLRIDQEVMDGDRLTMDYVFKSASTMWGTVDAFSLMLLGDHCRNIREGNDPLFLKKAVQSREWGQAKKLCGKSDDDLSIGGRMHPETSRTLAWLEIADAADSNYSKLRQSIAQLDGLMESSGTQAIGPDRVLDKCEHFSGAANIEDRIENLYVCLDAFELSLLDYDYARGAYAESGQSQNVLDCAKGIVQGSVEIGADGTPRLASRNRNAVGGHGATAGTTNPNSAIPNSATPNSAATSSANSPTSSGGAGSATTSGVTSKNGMQGTPPVKGPITRAFHFPADNIPTGTGTYEASNADSCVVDYGDFVKDHAVQLPKTLSTVEFQNIYQSSLPDVSERGDYAYSLSRQQAGLLMHAYLIEAMEQPFASPRDFDANIKQFVNSCGHAKLRTELQNLANLEYLNAENRTGQSTADPGLLATLKHAILGNAPDPTTETAELLDDSADERAAAQVYTAESEGRRMVDAAERIEALHKLTDKLTYDFGASEVSILHYPDWMKYLPIVHFMAGQPMSISFGDQYLYQCGLFKTLPTDDFVTYSPKLVTESDAQLRQLLSQDGFEKLAFCNGPGNCRKPEAFDYYLGETHQANFSGQGLVANAGRQISLRVWCSMRWKAAEALTLIENELINLHPVLAYASPLDPSDSDSKLGPSVLEQILRIKTSRDDRIRFAATQSRQALPLLQKHLISYLSKICDDLVEAKMDSVYIATLDPVFRNGFDYCGTLPESKRVRGGLSCDSRLPYIECRMKQEADEWLMHKQMPGFFAEVGMAAMDAFVVFSLAAAPLDAVLSLRGVAVGGLSGTAFTAANYGLTYALARYNEGSWDEANQAKAGLALEGAESYTDALTAISASHPKAALHDFIVGFVLGAVMSAHGGGSLHDGIVDSGSGGHGVPKAFAEELANKVTDAATPKEGGGVEFDPSKLASIKEWIAQQSGASPELAGQLEQNLSTAMVDMSEAAYRTAFDGAAGKLLLVKVKRVLRMRLRNLAEPFSKALADAKGQIAAKKFSGKPLSQTESFVERAELSGTDLERLNNDVSPRATAALTDALEEGLKPGGPDETASARLNRVDRLVRRLCGLAVVCPALMDTLGGCHL